MGDIRATDLASDPRVSDIVIANRTASRADDLARRIKGRTVDWETAAHTPADAYVMALATDAHGDMLDGLRFARTKLGDDGKAVIVPGDIQNVEAPMVISSIGSIPMPIKGLPMDGEFLRLDDKEHGRVTTFENVFGCGNVITGKGNLVASRKHSRKIAEFLVEHIGADAKPRTDVDALMAHVREQQAAVGYDGKYHKWIGRVTVAAHSASPQ